MLHRRERARYNGRTEGFLTSGCGALLASGTELGANYAAVSGSPTVPTAAMMEDYHLLEEVDPVYPQQALQQGLVGWVLIEFTLATDGRVQGPVLLDYCGVAANDTVDQTCADNADPIFNDAALQALRQFRYRPRLVGGQAVAVEGVQYRFSFQLAEAKQPLEQEED